MIRFSIPFVHVKLAFNSGQSWSSLRFAKVSKFRTSCRGLKFQFWSPRRQKRIEVSVDTYQKVITHSWSRYYGMLGGLDSYRKPWKNYGNDGNFRETSDFFNKTLGHDWINNNTPLGIITYTNQLSMMVVETNTLMTYVVTYEQYENNTKILKILNETLGNVKMSIIIHLETVNIIIYVGINSWNQHSRDMLLCMSRSLCWRLVKNSVR